MWPAVENERLTWELSQLQGLVDADELARLRTDIDTLRQHILQMGAKGSSDVLQRQPLQDLTNQQDPAQACCCTSSSAPCVDLGC